MGLSRPQQIGNVTHNQLTGRGESNAHPQSSIENLVETLSSFNTSLGAKLSPEDIVNDVVSGGADKVASAETVKTLNASIQLINVDGMLTEGDVQDTLSSTATNLPLSANKGRELFQYANDGKGLIATAINNRGVVASSSDTFSALAGKIREIAPAPEVVGDAGVGDVLAGKTFSTATMTGATGTMANQGAKTLTPGANPVSIPAGYHNGAGVVSAVANLSAGNVANGVIVGGVTGTYKGIGTATAGDVLADKTFSTGALSGASGTMVNRGAMTLTPGASAVTIPAGYHNGSGVVSAIQNLTPENIKKNVVVGGTTGILVPGVKSIQTLRITSSGAKTITSVVPANTIVIFQAYNQGSNEDWNLVLTNATTLTVSGAPASGIATIIEFESGAIKSKQRVTVNTGIASGTAIAISSVNPAKCIVMQMATNHGSSLYATNGIVTGATELTVYRSSTSFVSYLEVIEFN